MQITRWFYLNWGVGGRQQPGNQMNTELSRMIRGVLSSHFALCCLKPLPVNPRVAGKVGESDPEIRSFSPLWVSLVQVKVSTPAPPQPEFDTCKRSVVAGWMPDRLHSRVLERNWRFAPFPPGHALPATVPTFQGISLTYSQVPASPRPAHITHQSNSKV